MKIAVAGIHTGIGKTVCSAILTQALRADYWKPVQAGDLHASDSIFVRNHIDNDQTVIHPEATALKRAASPHWAAAEEGREICLSDFRLPDTSRTLLVETAGGVMSPLSSSLLNLDLIRHLNLPAVLVSGYYLGSINHTLLSVAAIRQAGIPLAGIVFCGEEVPSSRQVILDYTGLPEILCVPRLEPLNREAVCGFAASVASTLKQKLHEFTGKR